MELRAFIGHSFTNDDVLVVKAFLDYFAQLQDMSFGFSWENAKAAEPKALAEKVLSLIQGKNLFIGICTKKELVIEQNKLRKVGNKKELQSSIDNFEMKTSDWIIQEIGLAIGKGMYLILLVEDGLRSPGGLQGNIEYIPFDRNVPEKSFGKILEKIRSLMPTSAIVRGEEQRSEAASEPEIREEETTEDMLRPRPEWKFRQYNFAYFNALMIGNAEAEKTLVDSYQETEEGQQSENKIRWEASRIFLKGIYGKAEGSISALEKLAAEYPNSEYSHYYLAKVYENFQKYKEAAKSYIISGNMSHDTKDTLLRYKDAANAWIKDGDIISAEQCLENILLLSKDDKSFVDIAIEVKIMIAENEANNYQILALTEYWMDIHPDDNTKRFDIAYKYSQNKLDSLSLLHYNNIPILERNGGSWNNLGVQYNFFELYSKSITCYRKSADEYNETLAMSNIANKLLASGFIKEAEEICKKGISIENYHKNILYSITKIKELPEQEEAKEKEILAKAKKLRDFFAAYGKAILDKEAVTLSGNWISPKCSVTVTLNNGEFIAEGSFDVKGTGLGPAAIFSLQETQVTKYKVIYRGKLTGMSIQGTLVIERDD